MTSQFEATRNRVPSTTMPGAPKVAVRVARTLRARLIEPMIRWHQCASMIRQLRALDDRILDDIGISRDRIPDVVAQAYASRFENQPAATGAAVHRLPVGDKDGQTARVDILRSKAA